MSSSLPLGALCLVLLSAFLHACWNALVKSSGDRLVLLTAVVGVSGIMGLVALPFVDPPGWDAAPWLAGSILSHIFYYICLLSAYREGDLSQVYPIARGSAPMLTAAIAWFLLGEGLRPAQLGGVFMVSAGVLVIAYIRMGGISHFRSVAWALGVAVCIAAYSSIDAAGIRASDTGLGYISWLLALDCLPLVLFTAFRRRGLLTTEIRRTWRVCLGGGLIAGVSYGSAVWVFQYGATAGVVALRETSVLFAALIGVFFLGERFGPRRITAALFVAAGVITISIF